MQVRQYPFQIDAPLSPALRDTMLVASFLARACRSVLRARDQRVRAARVVEVPARAPAEVPAFRSALGECGIEVVEFDQTLSSLMADPEKAPTVKELMGSLSGKRAAAPDLGARVQELLARCGAAPRKSGMAAAPPMPAASPPQTSPGPQPSAAPPAPRAAPAASRRERPRSKDFRWDLTAAARASEGCPSPETDPLEAAAPSSAPAQDAVSGEVRAERTVAQTDPTSTTAGTTPDESPGAPASTVPPATVTNGSPPVGPVAPPLKDDGVPTEVGIVVALEELGRQAENLQRRVEALEALIASQARRLEEAERKLEAVLRRTALTRSYRVQALNA